MVRSRSWFRLAPAVVAVLAAVLGLPGCADTDSMPTLPSLPETPSAWTRIYPDLTTANLNAAWGMDADDMWAVGDRSTFLHWDGSTVRSFGAVGSNFLAIDGIARDAIWAIDNSRLHRFDGRRWIPLVSMDGLRAESLVACAMDAVYVGGSARCDTSYSRHAAVHRFDGANWQDTRFPEIEDESVRKLWMSPDEQVVMAATSSRIYRLSDDGWEALRRPILVTDTDGRWVLARYLDEEHAVRQLFHISADGSGVRDDGAPSDFPVYDCVAQARMLLMARGAEIDRISSYYDVEPALTGGDQLILDLAVPTLPNAYASTVFAAGRNGLFLQGIWQPDQSLVWRDLVPGLTLPLANQALIDGDDDRLYVAAQSEAVLVWDGREWHAEDIDFSPRNLRALGDGYVVASHEREMSCRQPDGRWLPWPACPEEPRALWADRDANALALDHSSILWRLEAGAWARTDSLTWPARWLDACSVDDIYTLDILGVLHHRGDSGWTPINDPDTLRISGAAVGRISGDMYISGTRMEDGHSAGTVTAVLRDDAVVELPGSGLGAQVYWCGDEVCEIAPGRLCCYLDSYHFSSGIRMFDDTGWSYIASPHRYNSRVWAHADRGIFLLGSGSNIYHRNLDEGTP